MGVKEKESIISFVFGILSLLILVIENLNIRDLINETFNHDSIIVDITYMNIFLLYSFPILAIIFGMISLKSKKIELSIIGMLLGFIMIIVEIYYICYELSHFSIY